MKIIGEKINGTRKSVGKAIVARDSEFIISLAKAQVDAGAALLDVNAGTTPDRESDDLVWLVHTVQDAVDIQLCLDSSRPEPLKAAIKEVKQKPMINSISGESKRLDDILPLAAEHDCEVIALALDETGIPKTADSRFEVVSKMMNLTREHGLSDDKIYIDPLVMSVATDMEAANITLEVIRRIKNEYPEAHITMGLSNVSFGLPNRLLINRTFLSLALAFGMDSAIIDPTEAAMCETLLATELLLGRDRFCRKYTGAHRDGSFSI